MRTTAYQVPKPNEFPYDLDAGCDRASDGTPVAWVTRRTPLGEPVQAHPDEPPQWRTWAAVSTKVFGVTAPRPEVIKPLNGVTENADAISALQFLIPAGAEVSVATAVAGPGAPLQLTKDPANPLPKALAIVKALTPETLDRMEREHRQWWAGYWKKSRVALPDEPKIEQVYYGALYVFGACNRPGDYTSGCNSFGIDDGPMWTGDYHWNYNIEAPYYLAGSCDRAELIDPFDRAVREHDEKLGRKMAQMSGHQGTFFCIGTGPGGHINENTAGYGHRTNAVEAAIVQLDVWQFTHDLEWAKRVYSFLRQVALYWDADLLEHKEALPVGSYRYNIVNNAPLEGCGGGPKGPKQNLNATPAIGFLRRFYQVMIPLTEELNAAGFETGFQSRSIAAWRDILAHLPAYPTTTADGRSLFQWSEGDPDPYSVGGWHWNLLQVYPCHQISLSSDPKLIQTALDTLYMRPEVLGRGSPHTEWYGINARLGNYPPEFLERLNWYIDRQSGPCHFFTQGGNIECVAIADQINSLLLQSQEGFLRFFPAYHHPNAAFQNIRAEGAFLVTASKHLGVCCDVSIVSEKGLPCTILNPWPGRKVLVSSQAGLPVATDCETKPYGELARFDTKPHAVYTVRPEGGYPAALPMRNVALGAKVVASSTADPAQKDQQPLPVLAKSVPPGKGRSPRTWQAANLTDGNRHFQSLLCENMGWSSVPADRAGTHEFVTIELNRSYNLDEIDLWPMTRGDMRYGRYDKENVPMDHSYNGFPLDFTIQVSNDGNTWNTVVLKKDYLAMAAPDQKPKDATEPERFKFDPAMARFVKVDMTCLRKSRYFGKYTAGFAEIEVLRSESNTK